MSEQVHRIAAGLISFYTVLGDDIYARHVGLLTDGLWVFNVINTDGFAYSLHCSLLVSYTGIL